MVLPGIDARNQSFLLACPSTGRRRNALRDPYCRRSTDYPGPTAIRPRRRERRRIANHLASGEPAVARNVGAGVADARTHRARLRNIRLWPVRFSGGGSSGTIVGDLDVCFWHKADIPRLSSNVRFWG